MACVQLGDTFYWKEGGHLWIVISDPQAHGGEFIVVNLTKDAFRAGKECELQPNEHKWITVKTYVSFRDAQKYGAKEEVNLAKQIALGTIKKHLPVSTVLLQKIVNIGKQSKTLSDGYKVFL